MGGLLLTLAALLAAPVPATPRGLQPEDLHRLRSIGEVQIAPDGRRLLYSGLETALVRYPREGHGLGETGHVVGALQPKP